MPKIEIIYYLHSTTLFKILKKCNYEKNLNANIVATLALFVNLVKCKN